MSVWHMCLSRQKLSRDEHTFVTSKDSREKSKLVTTKVLSQQNCLARQKLCRDILLVAEKDVFCRDKHVCRDKTFVAT